MNFIKAFSERLNFTRPAVLLGALVLAGCGGGGGGSSSGGGNNDTSPGVGAISASTSSLDFGDVVVNSTAARSFTISNTGDASFPVGSTNPGDPFSVDRPCDSLAPGESCTITVQFTPRDQGEFTSSFDAGSDEINTTINLTGEGKGLAVQISSVSQSCPDPSVSVRARVSDPNAVPVTGLNDANFTATLGGDAIEGVSFDAVSIEESASVGLMIDWSNSLQDFRDTLVNGSDVFIDSLRDIDSGGLFRFATAVDENAVDFIATDDPGKQALKDGLRADFSGATSPTLLWDVVSDVLGRAESETSDNRIIVLLTDGFDDNSDVSLDAVIDDANAKNTSVFTIGFGEIEFEPLERLADETGGRFFPSPDLDDLGTIYETILGLLSNQYEITFENPTPDTTATFQIVVQDDMSREGDDSREIPACE